MKKKFDFYIFLNYINKKICRLIYNNFILNKILNENLNY